MKDAIEIPERALERDWTDDGLDFGARLDLRHAAFRALAALRNPWRPIEEAPMDGTWVLICGGNPDNTWDRDEPMPPCVVAQSVACEGMGRAWSQWMFASYDSGWFGEYKNPTHWQPLPPAPEQP